MKTNLTDSKCKICKSDINEDYYREQLCFRCYHWINTIFAEIDNNTRHRFIIDGNHYCEIKKFPIHLKYLLKFYGDNFTIRLLDNNAIILCNNLWSQGKIPEIIKEKFPKETANTAMFESIQVKKS